MSETKTSRVLPACECWVHVAAPIARPATHLHTILSSRFIVCILGGSGIQTIRTDMSAASVALLTRHSNTFIADCTFAGLDFLVFGPAVVSGFAGCRIVHRAVNG